MSDVSAPYITPTELLSYHGDPALGIGGGINYSNNPAVQNPLQSFDQYNQQALQEGYKEKQIAIENENRRRELDHQAAIQQKQLEFKAGQDQQDKMFDYLTKTGSSIFNQKDQNGNDMSIQPLPDDQKELQGRMNDAMQGVYSKPGSYQYDPNVMSKANEALSLNKVAQNRAYQNTQLQLMAAQTDDPEEKKRIEDYRKKEITDKKLSDNHWVQPYMPTAPVNYNSFAGWDQKSLQNKEAKTTYGEHFVNNPDGSISKESYEGLDPRAVDKRADWYADKNQQARIQRFVANQLPSLTPDRVQAIDKVNNYVNTVNGWKQDDPHYIPQLEDAVKSGDAVQSLYALNGGMLMNPTKQTNVHKTADEVIKSRVDIDKSKKDAEKQTEWESKQETAKKNVTQSMSDLEKTFSSATRGITMTVKNKDEKGNIIPGTKNVESKFTNTPPLNENNPDVGEPGLYKNIKDNTGIDPAGLHPIFLPPTTSLKEAAPEVFTYAHAASGSVTPKAVKMEPTRIIQLMPPDGNWQNSKIVYKMPYFNPNTGAPDGFKYEVRTPQEVALATAKDDVHKQFTNEAIDNGWKVKEKEQSAPEPTKPTSSAPPKSADDNSAAAIRGRLIPTKAKVNGKIIDALKDPITKKLYPKDA